METAMVVPWTDELIVATFQDSFKFSTLRSQPGDDRVGTPFTIGAEAQVEA